MSEETQAAPHALGRVRKLSDITDQNLQKAFEAHANGERVTWQTSIMGLPSQVPGQMVAMCAIYIMIPGAVLGTDLYTVAMAEPAALLNEEAVGVMARDLLFKMRESRSQQLAQMQQEGAQANGGVLLPPGVMDPNLTPEERIQEALSAHMDFKPEG